MVLEINKMMIWWICGFIDSDKGRLTDITKKARLLVPTFFELFIGTYGRNWVTLQ